MTAVGRLEITGHVSVDLGKEVTGNVTGVSVTPGGGVIVTIIGGGITLAVTVYVALVTASVMFRLNTGTIPVVTGG